MTTPGTPTTGSDSTTEPEASVPTTAGPQYWPAPKPGKDSPAVVAAAAISEAKQHSDITQDKIANAEWRLSRVTQRAQKLAAEERLASLSVAVRAAAVLGPATQYETEIHRRRSILITLWIFVAVLIIVALFGAGADEVTGLVMLPYSFALLVLAIGIATATLIATLFLRPVPLPELPGLPGLAPAQPQASETQDSPIAD